MDEEQKWLAQIHEHAIRFYARPPALRRAMAQPLHDLSEDLIDESSKWAIDGNPHRSFYVTYWSERARTDAERILGL